MQILGTGMDTGDTSACVLLFFDQRRFIFNAGEVRRAITFLVFSCIGAYMLCAEFQLSQSLCKPVHYVQDGLCYGS